VIAFDFQMRTRVVCGPGVLNRLGELASGLQFSRTLLVGDAGMVAAGYIGRAARRLKSAGIEVFPFHDFRENPTTSMIEAGTAFASVLRIDSIVGLGGGSSLDCAKGVNFLLTQGGAMQDYRGFGKARQPMLPMIGIPTTAGTGSEAQCYALISDAVSHQKMACGDPKAAFRIALLDPELTVSQPAHVTAVTGFDAISHAVETFVSKARTPLSEMYSREAWRLLEAHYQRVIVDPGDLQARAAMQLGAYLAGVAIDLSMLGATHACANPLTARYGTTHGIAIAAMLPHVVRWNAAAVGGRYSDMMSRSSGEASAEALAERLEELAAAGGLPHGLKAIGVPREDLPQLALEAATQMTGGFNPRPFDADAARELYERAYADG